MYHFELWFSLAICPGVGLLGHTRVLFRVFVKQLYFNKNFKKTLTSIWNPSLQIKILINSPEIQGRVFFWLLFFHDESPWQCRMSRHRGWVWSCVSHTSWQHLASDWLELFNTLPSSVCCRDFCLSAKGDVVSGRTRWQPGLSQRSGCVVWWQGCVTLECLLLIIMVGWLWQVTLVEGARIYIEAAQNLVGRMP